MPKPLAFPGRCWLCSKDQGSKLLIFVANVLQQPSCCPDSEPQLTLWWSQQFAIEHGHVYLVFTLKMMMFHTYVGVLDGKTTWSPTSLHDLAVVAQPTASSIAPCAERRSSKSSALGDVSIAMVKSFWNHCRLYLGHCQRSMAKEGGGWSWNTDDRKLL